MKIDIDQVNLTPCIALWVFLKLPVDGAKGEHVSFLQRSCKIGLTHYMGVKQPWIRRKWLAHGSQLPGTSWKKNQGTKMIVGNTYFTSLNECLPIHFYILIKLCVILDSSYSNAGILKDAVHSISRIFDEHLSFQKFM